MTSTYSDLLKAAIRFLGIRPRSTWEITVFLQSRFADSKTIDLIIHRLEELKLLDDQEFLNWYVGSRSRTKPRSTALLVRELRNMGVMVSPQDIPQDDRKEASRALQKKHHSWLKLPFQQYRIKAFRFLTSRGFSPGIIEPVLKMEYNDAHVS